MLFLIILSLLIGIILRLIAINQSLWLDEAISFQAATKYSFLGILNQFMPKDFNPPLYYLILHFWLKFFPSTEFFIRLPSVIFGLLTSLFIYKIYLLVFKEKRGAFLSLLLLITSPLHIYYSQEARMYSLAAFTVTASMYYFIKLLRGEKRIFTPTAASRKPPSLTRGDEAPLRRRRSSTASEEEAPTLGGRGVFTFYLGRRQAGFLLFTLLTLYSHYLCWSILLVQFIYLLIYEKNQLKKFFTFYFLLFTFYLPWLPTLFRQFKIGQRVALGNIVWGKIVGGLSLKTIVLLPVKFIIGRTSFENKNVYLVVVLTLGLLFGFLLWQAATKKQSQLAKLIWFWLIVPPILGILISFQIPVFSYFRFLFCLPAFYLLIARGIFSFERSKEIIVLILLINLSFSFKYLLNQNFHREDWKKAIQVLHQKNTNKDYVLILQNVTAPFDYYDKEESRLIFFDQKEAVANENNVWLIPYAQPIFDPQDLTRKFLQAKGFQRVYEEHFRGVTLEKWQKLMAIRYNRV